MRPDGKGPRVRAATEPVRAAPRPAPGPVPHRPWDRFWALRRHTGPLAGWLLLLAVALGLQLAGLQQAADLLLTVGCAAAAALEAWRMVQALRQGRIGLDVLALAAIVSTLAVGERWAAGVIVLMLLGGEALEDFAAHRAEGRLRALLAAAPRDAHRLVGDAVEDVQIDRVEQGDVLLVRPGEVMPVDCDLQEPAELDLSRLTGESLPVDAPAGSRALSGAVVLGSPAVGRAVAGAADSEYQRIVGLVAEASRSRAPMVRLADRYALPFSGIAFALAGLGWLLSGDPQRFAEVLVVATPCPLLLAAPIAFVAGIGRAAHHGVVVREGGALEVLSRVRTMVLDKTGTVTRGRPVVTAVRPVRGDPAALLAVAAAVERWSTHVLAAAVVAEAERRRLPERTATDVTETVGGGVRARVGEEVVLVGKPELLQRAGVELPPDALAADRIVVDVAVGGRYAGRIELADRPRPEAATAIAALPSLGVRQVLLVTGDRRPPAEAVAAEVGIPTVHAGCRPEDKVRIVRDLPDRPVAMVGDGVNDAPVLAAADVGIAMGARGSSAASESADVVVLVDDLSRVVDGVRVARRTVRIALQAILVGIGISIGLMVVALTGVLPALLGAALQEVVDVLTILLALRAASDGAVDG